MNTLIFNSGESGYGGCFKSCYFIADILKKNGYSPNVISINDSFYWNRLEHEGIRIKIVNHIFYSREKNNNFFNKNLRRIFFRFKKNKYFLNFLLIFNDLIHFSFMNSIKKFVKERKIKLIHTNLDFFKDISVYKAAVDLKLPVICHLRTIPKRKLTYLEKRLSGYKFSLFIAISKAVLEEWVKAGIPGFKIKLIYNSQEQIKIDEPDYEKDPVNSNSNIHLLFVGRLVKRKGIDLLIKALSCIDNKNWILSIVGEGSEMENLRRLAKEKGLLQKITFYGFQEDVDRFYKSHNILIVPSLNEPFGRVIIEAMQYDIAIIGSNNGGIPEIIDDGKDGILFETGDVKALSKAIENLIDDHDKRTKLGLQGKEKINTMFSEKNFNRELIKTYDQILKIKSE